MTNLTNTLVLGFWPSELLAYAGFSALAWETVQETDASKTTKSLDPEITDSWGSDYVLYPD